MVHTEPATRSKGREHGLVRVILALCRCLFGTRFGKNWSLSPELSLSLRGGDWTVTRQLAVRALRAQPC